MLHHIQSGNLNGPAVLMGSSLGTTFRMWENILPHLEEHYRVIRFDTPGHGHSAATSPAVAAGETSGATVAGFATAVLDLADALGIETFSYIGLSLGGAIGQQLALDAPERLENLIVTCTAAKFGAPEIWQDRARNVREQGMDWLREPSAGKWYTPGFAERDEAACLLLDDLVALDPEGYAQACDAVSKFDVTAQLPSITTPTLVIAGAEDVSTPPAVVQIIADTIPEARFEVVAGAAHIGNLEAPEAYGVLIAEFLQRVTVRP